jgi:hypothetical protein
MVKAGVWGEGNMIPAINYIEYGVRIKMSNIIYQCFSYAQKEFLLNQGHNILCSGLHCENKKKFWCFIKVKN